MGEGAFDLPPEMLTNNSTMIFYATNKNYKRPYLMMRLFPNSNLGITGYFVNQVSATAIMEALMEANSKKALLLAGEYPAMMFHRVHTQSSHGDPMFMSPLEFAVLTGRKGVLLALKAIAEKAGFINAYNAQKEKIENDIALTLQSRHMKMK